MRPCCPGYGSRDRGCSVTPQDLTDKVFLPERQGSLQLELIAASRRYGRLPYVLDQEFAALLAEVMAGRPVLVLQNLGLASYPIWHYAVVIGFDPAREALILRSGDRQRLALGTRKFLRSWALADNWAMVVLRPGEFPVGVDETRYLRAIAALEATDQVDTALAFYAPVLSRWPDNTVALFGIGKSILCAATSYRLKPATGTCLMSSLIMQPHVTISPSYLPTAVVITKRLRRLMLLWPASLS